MSDKLNEKLLGSIDKVEEFIGSAASEAPAVAQELMAYNLLVGSLLFAICLLLSIFFARVIWLERKKEARSPNEREEISGKIVICSILAVTSWLIGVNLLFKFEVFKVLIAPKVFLLEYVRGLL